MPGLTDARVRSHIWRRHIWRQPVGDWRAEIARRLAHLRLDPAREAEIVDELSQHLDDRYDELRGQGVPATEAAETALRELDATDALGKALGGPRDRPVSPNR